VNSQLRKVIAAVAITVLTMAVIGVLVVTLTPLGCGPGNAIGMKSVSGRCAKPVGARPSPYPSPIQWTPYPFRPLPDPSYTPPASAPVPPDSRPASAAYPPFFPASSASGTFTPATSLNCRLPVYAGQSGSGGFIVFPGSTFIPDPASGVSLPAGAPAPAPSGPGYGQGYGGMSYDRAFAKWLPVPLNWVSPDGSKYAFASSNSVWVQNVADSAHVLLGEGQPWSVVAFLSDGVYASAPGSAGLWLLPLSGAPKQIATTGYWRAAAAGAAYGTPTSAVPQGASNGIIRLDLKTGAVTDWFARGNSQAYVLGFDAQGYPVVQVNYPSPINANEVWLTTGPSKAVPLSGSFPNSYQYGQPPNLSGVPVGDSHGIWFQAYAPGTNGGMAIYVPGSGIYWMANIGGQLAGGCY
jgi:hypothetical protein